MVMMEEFRQLELEISKRAQLYYDTGDSGISDSDFDLLVDRLRLINPDSHILKSVGWGYDVTKNTKKKMNHLGNCYGISDKRFVEMDYEINSSNSILTGKFDGGNVELIYNNGILVRALTRGNGVEGFDVTHILRYVAPIKLEMNYTGDIVGEFIIPEQNYRYFDSDSVRNIPNGFLMRDNVTEEECKRFSFVPYKVYKFKPIKNYEIKTKMDVMNLIEDLGFPTVSLMYDDVVKFDKMFNDNLKLVYYPKDGRFLSYSLDGIVVTHNHVKISEDNDGYLSIEYNEYALKTRTDTADVKITSFRWNLTRTGRVVPTACYNPVFLSGATCTHALAHNAKNVLDNKMGVGSTIKVVRSGEVIPYIMEVVEPCEVELPTICPSCSHELKWSGKDLICDNPECEGQSYSRIFTWLNTLGGVHNLGGSLLADFIEKYEIDDISDIYEKDDISFSSLYEIEGVGRAKVELITQMYKRLYEEHTLEEYLVALNIPKISWNTADKIVKGANLYANLDQLDESKDSWLGVYNAILYNTSGVGPAVVQSLVDHRKRFIDNLKYVKICKNIDKNKRDNKESDVYNDRLRIYVTGKLEKFKSRSQIYTEFSNLVEECKDIKSCDYFITNKQPLSTNHYKQAVESGIKIINEEEFMKVLERRML